MSRKTEFWKSSTPDKLGPGCYTSSNPEKIKQNKTAFLIKSKRQLSAPRPYNRFTPGPGAYDQSKDRQSSISHNSSGFASKTKRELFQPFSNPDTPGPGSYETRVSSAASQKRRPKFSALYLDPSPVSIPSNEVNSLQIGQPSPVEPQVHHESESKGTAFGKYKAVRQVFAQAKPYPGPGSYNLEKPVQGSESWMFVSSTGRAESPALIGGSSAQVPGPGYYSITPTSAGRAGLFTIAAKELPLTNNPYLPIQVGTSEVPPVGSYKLAEDIKKAEKLKAKYVTGDIQTKRAPFNTQEKRQMPWLPKENFPGPGDYSVLKIRPKSTGFRSTRPRFELSKNDDLPGPGHYDFGLVEKEKQVIVNKSPRFVKEDTKTPEPYLGHSEWTAKRTRAPDFEKFNPGLYFDSGQSRFRSKAQNENLGPGCYEKERPFTVSSSKVSTTERFQAFGSFRPGTGTSQKLGPGYYNPSISQKKSFNMGKEINLEKTWL
jgi:hypothetical protein